MFAVDGNRPGGYTIPLPSIITIYRLDKCNCAYLTACSKMEIVGCITNQIYQQADLSATSANARFVRLFRILRVVLRLCFFHQDQPSG